MMLSFRAGLIRCLFAVLFVALLGGVRASAVDGLNQTVRSQRTLQSAQALEREGKHLDAAKVYQAAAKDFEHNRLRDKQIEALTLASKALSSAGKKAEALRVALQAHSAAVSSGDLKLEADVLPLVVSSCIAVDQWMSALDFQRRLVAVQKQRINADGAFDAQNDLCELMVRLDRPQIDYPDPF
jgi:hypothetical protein